MKKLLTAILITASVLGARAQNISNNYFETNIGISKINFGDDAYFPGISLLFGHRKIMENNMVVDAQFGLAAPSVVTGKIGIGYRFPETRTIISAGIRPFPAHAYTQLECFNKAGRSSWVFSSEVSAYTLGGHPYEDISFASEAIFTIGYRFYFKEKT